MNSELTKSTCFIDNEKTYHNTKLLLSLYPKVLWRIEQSINDLNSECCDIDDKSLYDLIDSLIDVDTQIDKIRFENRLRSIEESKSLIELIRRALVMLKSYPDNGERYFDIIDKLYLSDIKCKYTEDKFLTDFNISRATLYREKRKAITTLGIILWGFIIPEVVGSFRIDETKMIL